MHSHSIKTSTITGIKAVRDGYFITYGALTLKVYTDECNFVPAKGQRITVGLVGNRITSLIINGRKIR